jgi:branched-subunit amino acid transport protein
MTDSSVLITLIGMAVVTYLPRVLPAWMLRGRKLHPLLMQSLLVEGGKFNLAWDNLYLWAALPAGLVAWKTRSMFATVLVGMLVVAAARLLFA